MDGDWRDGAPRAAVAPLLSCTGEDGGPAHRPSTLRPAPTPARFPRKRTSSVTALPTFPGPATSRIEGGAVEGLAAQGSLAPRRSATPTQPDQKMMPMPKM